MAHDNSIRQKIACVMDREKPTSIWSLSYFSLVSCISISLALVLFYLYIIKPYVFLPADILSWEETIFVGDMIKLHTGKPIFTPPEDSNSSYYTPAARLLTYSISWIMGKSTSIVAWRIIQLLYVFFSAIVATISSFILNRLAYPNQRSPFPKTWFSLIFFAMFLAGTSPRVNRFAHALHSDALVLLVVSLSFLAMLLYLKFPSWKNILLMSIFPALGFLTKQNIISLYAVMLVFLILHNPKKVKHLFLFIAAAAALIGITIAVSYIFWGDNFIFWVFKAAGGARAKISFSAGAINISLFRSLEHTIRVWMEVSIGIVGGIMILRGFNIRKFGPLWISWLALILSEAFISGSGWSVLYHFGPGVLIGAVWMFAALPRIWPYPKTSKNTDIALRIFDILKPLFAAAGIFTIFIALRVVPTAAKYEARYWKRSPSPDVYRYISDIEQEFEGLPPDKVLLDVGNWIYLRHFVLIKDRATSLADQPAGGNYENIDAMINRIRNRTYVKILVRDFHSPFFLYDWVYWDRPSGVRKVLLENYNEVRIIPAAEGDNMLLPQIAFTGPVSVLLPKTDSNLEFKRNGK